VVKQAVSRFAARSVSRKWRGRASASPPGACSRSGRRRSRSGAITLEVEFALTHQADMAELVPARRDRTGGPCGSPR